MGRRLYVGNLPYSATDEDLNELFSRAGAVANVHVMRDQATGRARGFAFVEMTTDEGAQKAIDELHEYQMDGRALVVNEARPKPSGGGGGGFGGGVWNSNAPSCGPSPRAVVTKKSTASPTSLRRLSWVMRRLALRVKRKAGGTCETQPATALAVGMR